MSYWGYAPYVSVAARRAKAEKAAAKATKAGATLSPIAPYRGAIAKTFWGKAWCDNLEHYSDYANRLPRGRTYVRNGSVIDLHIANSDVQAKVMGSSLYTVKITVAEVAAKHWQAIGADCAGSIDSMVELLQGKLTKPVMERMCKPQTGLFPAPKDIRFSCSCPDSASMCKHIAAVLYGVGARLDQQPELLFKLRQVDAKDLVAQAGAGLPKGKRAPAASKVLDDSELADVFGLELDEAVAEPVPKAPRDKVMKVPVDRKKIGSKATKSVKVEPKDTAAKVVKKVETGRAATESKVGKKVNAAAATKTKMVKTPNASAKPASTVVVKRSNSTGNAAKTLVVQRQVKVKEPEGQGKSRRS
jgi:uncharacterized Zn finger protein